MNSRDITKALIKSIKGGTNPDVAVKNLLSFLEEEKLFSLIPGIIRELEHQARINHKKEMLEIKLAKEGTEEVINSIKRFVAGNNAPVALSVDPSLIGGFVATYKNKVYDGSLKTQLVRMRELLVK